MLKGVFVTLKEKEVIVKRIDDLNHKFHVKQWANDEQSRSILRVYCKGAIAILDECFANDLRGAIRCKVALDYYSRIDDINLVPNAFRNVFVILLELRDLAQKSIAISDLPSCKFLLDLSKEDALSLLNDLNQSPFFKVAVSAGLLGEKVGDAIHIFDVKNFYDNELEALQFEIKEHGGNPTNTEQFLLDKYKAELGYCYKVMIKTGVGAVKELLGLVDTIDKAIKRYEERSYHEVMSQIAYEK